MNKGDVLKHKFLLADTENRCFIKYEVFVDAMFRLLVR